MHNPHQDIGYHPPALTAAPLAGGSLPLPERARPVLAVVGDEGCCQGVMDRGIALAESSGAPLHVGVLHRRIRFTTDPALIAYVDRRLRQRVHALHADLARRSVYGCAAPVEVLTYNGSPLLSRRVAAWRAVEALAETMRALVVVAPWELSEVAWSGGAKGGRTLVGVPDDADFPIASGRRET